LQRARLVLFVQPRSYVSRALVGAVLDAGRTRSDVEVAAVCDTDNSLRPARGEGARTITRAIVKRMFDDAQPIVLRAPMWQSLDRITGRAGVQVIAPEGGSVNDPGFIERLSGELRADFAMSLVCAQIFRPELLSAFAGAVNYHDGLLPFYRGLDATNWSVYRGESSTGFTFHRMTPGIDEGPVLIQGAVPIRDEAGVRELELQKTLLAMSAVERVLDAMMRDEPGSPQSGPPGYFSHRDRQRIRTIADPSLYTWDELARRLRAFEILEMTIGGRHVDVTKLRRLQGSDRSSFAFRTADRVRAAATRFRYLPYPLYAPYRLVRRRRESD
jgi:methionyl-tRNA formyltransferase